MKAENLILNTIGKDWKSSGRCNFDIAKERFLLVLATPFVLQKKSQCTEYFNRGYVAYVATFSR